MKVAVFGAGKVGVAMSLEMPGVQLVSRGDDVACDYACICWPAHALRDFAATHPRAARAYKIAFCNGVWARQDGADEQGCCYVRLRNKGDRAAPGGKGWRVRNPNAAHALNGKGLDVVCSRQDHPAHVWGKALYILPLAIACSELDVGAKEAEESELWAEWFNTIRTLAVAQVGEEAMKTKVARVRYLLERSPRYWRPSSSPEEIAYFKERLCAAS